MYLETESTINIEELLKACEGFILFVDPVFYFGSKRQLLQVSNHQPQQLQQKKFMVIQQSFEFTFLIRMFPWQDCVNTRLAEWFKAPDLRSGLCIEAWVRTPHLVGVNRIGNS